MSHPLLKIIGINIKTLRKKRNWTQEEFAEIANINDKEVSHIEAGNRNITITTLVKISNAFEIAPHKLLTELTNIKEA